MNDQQQLTDNNDLVAKFMGIDFNSEDSWKQYAISICQSKGFYHKSWEWLMPVVEKINQFHVIERPFKYGKPEMVALRIHENRVTIEGTFWTNPNTVDGNYWSILKRKTFRYSNNTPIECVYLAVIEFIKWYNQNKL